MNLEERMTRMESVLKEWMGDIVNILWAKHIINDKQHKELRLKHEKLSGEKDERPECPFCHKLARYQEGYIVCDNCDREAKLEPVGRLVKDGNKVRWISNNVEQEPEYVVKTVEEQWDYDQTISNHWATRIRNLKKELIAEFIDDIKREIEYIKTINNFQDFDGELKQCIWVEHLESQLNKHIIEKWEARTK